MKRFALIVLAGIACIVIAGPQGWGRLALWSGFPAAAARLLSEPGDRGLALYRSGSFANADTAIRDAGRGHTFNRALTLAATGKYALSVDYFDAVLFANPSDEEARRLRDLVDRLVPKVRGESIAPGRIAAFAGQEGQPRWGQGNLGYSAHEWYRMNKARGIAASESWLETMSDDPGEFLRLRLAAEYERRASLGLIRPEDGDPW